MRKAALGRESESKAQSTGDGREWLQCQRCREDGKTREKKQEERCE